MWLSPADLSGLEQPRHLSQGSLRSGPFPENCCAGVSWPLKIQAAHSRDSSQYALVFAGDQSPRLCSSVSLLAHTCLCYEVGLGGLSSTSRKPVPISTCPSQSWVSSYPSTEGLVVLPSLRDWCLHWQASMLAQWPSVGP